MANLAKNRFHYGAATDYDEWTLITGEPECKEWAFDQFHK